MKTLLLSLCLFLSVLTCRSAESCEYGAGQCVDKQDWQFGLALGIGVRTNPLVDGDNIPLLLLPDIAWYGESFYLDNDEFGYQWYDSGEVALETFVNLNKEAAYFRYFHPSNVLFSNFSLSASFIGPARVPPPEVSKDDVATRRWAVNGGARIHIRQQQGEWQLAALTDVSSVHHGHQLSLSYSRMWQAGGWRIVLTPSLTWKSAALTDYYYGLGERDGVLLSYYFSGGSGWQPGLDLTVTKPLSEKWLMLFKASHTELHDGMTGSPLVQEGSINTLFMGAAYRF
ncbi:MipA/OmpV family protein [Lacimicrobium alkaliphilum]|uniref:Outer membrane MltA-interaction protein MipA n=1 Tax=Lacimicrobium alkaliphilum TaxID=1526571 RepID=A0ABQ1RHC0_9ALTE|nr:MipA/OmpV family protein [Lacimicrobium alkaliphilum]GGD70272.1 outer membrane MltA-interaction protein MipA [Lacimicrobium alkaliphilum]